MSTIEGGAALITGGKRIGAAVARALAAAGMDVALSYNSSRAEAEETAADVIKAGRRAHVARANLGNPDECRALVDGSAAAFGRLDVLVNMASVYRSIPFDETDEHVWHAAMDVDLRAAFLCARAAVPHMRQHGGGRIVNFADWVAASGRPRYTGYLPYYVAKAGTIALTEALALELAADNILVNAIAPVAGSRLTETVLPKELIDALKPELVSPLVAYLCHESSKETGGLFEVGGGVFNKLRWERTVGKTFKLGKPITVDAIAKAWPEITDFGKATHPPDLTTSMQPVLENLQKKSLGGNELIDVDLALGYELPALESSYTERDLALYALGVGVGSDPLDPKELQYVYEMHPDGFRALPTFAVIPAINAILEMAKQGKTAPGLNYGFERILHGEQYTELKRPLPPSAKLTHKPRIKDIWDKGRHAVVVTETRSYDESGEELMYNELTMLVRGAGGWGGERGPTGDVNVPPERAPDAATAAVAAAGAALGLALTVGISV